MDTVPPLALYLLVICGTFLGSVAGAAFAIRHKYWDTLLLAIACFVLAVVLAIVLARQ